MALCFYVPILTINASLTPVCTSYQCVCPVLLLCIFFCQCYLTINNPVYQCFRPLIDYHIDIYIWDCWDCFLSVIGPIRPVDAPFSSVVSMLPFVQQ